VDKVTKKPLKSRKINSFPQEPLIYAEKLLENTNLEERVGNDYPKGSKNKIFLKELKDSITKKYSGMLNATAAIELPPSCPINNISTIE
jgi:hypothetical protein